MLHRFLDLLTREPEHPHIRDSLLLDCNRPKPGPGYSDNLALLRRFTRPDSHHEDVTY